MNIEEIAKKATAIIEETGKWVKEERLRWDVSTYEHKLDRSLVTSIDLATEEKLVKGLGPLVEGSKFIAEENYKEKIDDELVWIIDPIDGTTNLVHNVPFYCISVALKKSDRIILGIIYEINRGECFWAHEGSEGAFLNLEAMSVSKTGSLEDCLLATGFPPNGFDHIDKYILELKNLMMNTRGIRRLGSAAMDLAYVACGRYDGFFEYSLNAWDVAAGAYLVEKAGGMVTDFQGGKDYLFGGQILASNGLFHQKFLTYFQQKVQL